MPPKKRFLWTCPRCGGGKLLGKSPRKDATARFCPPCSEKTGHMVERASPALERQRTHKANKRAAKAHKERSRVSGAKQDRKAQTEALWVVEGRDLRQVIRDLCKLPFLRNRGCRATTTAEQVIKQAVFYSRQRGVLGRASYGTPKDPGGIRLNAAVLAWQSSFPTAWDLVLHELLHAIGFRHSAAMVQALLVCAKQAWGGDPTDHGYTGKGNFGTYNADQVVIEMVEAALARVGSHPR